VDDGGNSRKLSADQLQTLGARGEIEVASGQFPGQVYTWRVSNLLQKGTGFCFCFCYFFLFLEVVVVSFS
jgi:hypothetical protein